MHVKREVSISRSRKEIGQIIRDEMKNEAAPSDHYLVVNRGGAQALLVFSARLRQGHIKNMRVNARAETAGEGIGGNSCQGHRGNEIAVSAGGGP